MRKLLATGIIIASVAAFTSSVLAAPMMELQPPPQDSSQAAELTPAPKANFQHADYRGKLHGLMVVGSWQRALTPERIKTPAEAKTVAQAAIILFGNPQEMQVGNVKPMKLRYGGNGYQITIIDARGDTIKTLIMNAKNGRLHDMSMQPLRAVGRK